MAMTTICRTDLHISKGDLSAVARGRVLGHEGVGVVETIVSGKAEPGKLITHRFPLGKAMKAYDTFGNTMKGAGHRGPDLGVKPNGCSGAILVVQHRRRGGREDIDPEEIR